ncbi:MAG TPA: glycosyltransferase [Ferruginibacter sp.]|jgi:glycosyltransferase involved in cell wall biosynthesis|nr:glycosyltransferase [Ferruginibacter sp.]
MDKKLNVLWLPGWFPSKVDFLPGDFIERHARSASLLMNIVVLFVVKDTSANGKNIIEVEHANGLVIYRGYYTCSTKLGLFGRVISTLRYYTLLSQLYKKAKDEKGPFDLAHIHIVLKQGLMGRWLRLSERLPYVITEQNSWYMPGDSQFFLQSFFVQWMTRKIFKAASAIHVVSESLGKALVINHVIDKPFIVIPNVVNTAIFTLDKTIDDLPGLNFIAVTGDIFHKNTDGVIRAFAAFRKSGADAKLHIAGPNVDLLKEIAQRERVEDCVVFYGAISNEAIAVLTKKCDAMIFFTRYETFGCVMAEAICCGVPVIASRLPVLEENLTEYENALFVTSEDESDLLNKLVYFAEHRAEFDATKIAYAAEKKYNYHTIAEKFKAFYLSIIQ